MIATIITPETELFAGSIKSVRVPGTKGQFQVLKGHAPIVSSLDQGTIHLVDEGGEKLQFEIERGFIEVLNDEVSLLVVEKTEEAEEA